MLTLSYSYGSTNNNGNVQSLTITPGAGQTPFQQSFTYDELNRLKSATETQSGGQIWKQTFVYDRYGNRWFDAANTTATVLGPLTSASDFNASNNRIVKPGYSYDQAGNLTAEPGKSYAYDAENRLTSAIASGVTTTYVYDGEGRRVRKNAGGVITRMIYNHLGQLVAEYNDSGSLIKEYIYKGGELLASYDASKGAEYATADHLGSPRIWTNSSGQVIAGGRHDYLPFGEELFAGVANRTTMLNYPSTAQADEKRHQFTSKERDLETNLDYFGERYYSSAQGRFVSVDPLMASTRLLEPQSFNRYLFVLNNPLRYVDPHGMQEKGAWDYLTEEEKRILAAKLVAVKNSKKITNKEMDQARKRFNDLTRGSDGKLDIDKVNTAINFIYATGGNKDSAIWQQISSIEAIGTFAKGTVEVRVRDRGDFLDTLGKSNYVVNPGWPVAGDHAFDSVRQFTQRMSDLSLHFANDAFNDPRKGPNYYFAHWDQNSVTSAETNRRLGIAPVTTALTLIQMGREHREKGFASPDQVREYLKRTGNMPKDR